jgi:hypothetical protein
LEAAVRILFHAAGDNALERCGRSAGEHLVENEAAGENVASRTGVVGQAEIQDLHAAIARDEDILRLQIAVDDAVLVRRRQAEGDLLRAFGSRFRLERAGLQALAQRPAFEQLRDQVRQAVVRADVVYGEDVGMVQRFEASDVAVENFNGDIAADAGIARAVNLAHAARAEQGDNLIRTKTGAGSQPHAIAIVS